MTITRELRIPIQEVSRVSIICATCKGEMVIDLTNLDHVEWAAATTPPKPATPKEPSGAPCVFCKTAFGKALRSTADLEKAFAALKDLEASFCIAESAIPQS
jgi:hypothetical protein